MSAPKLISPLLDNFVMGEPFYDENGIRILPAMEEGKEERYIVKIVSIPANQNQVDALLITGAYKDAEKLFCCCSFYLSCFSPFFHSSPPYFFISCSSQENITLKQPVTF